MPFARRLLASCREWALAPADARDLPLFRCLYCLFIAYHVAKSMALYSTLVYGGAPGQASLYGPVRLFALLRVPQFPPWLFHLTGGVLVASLLLAAAGVAARAALATAAVSWLAYWGTIYSAIRPPLKDRYTATTDMVLIVLLILLAAPGVGRCGLTWSRRGPAVAPAADETAPGWPLRAVQLFLALAFFGAAYGKLTLNGPRWADGATLQGYLLYHAMLSGSGLALWAAQKLWLCRALSVFTLALESTFWLVLVRPALAWVYVPAALGFHLGTKLAMDVNFLNYFAGSYFAFLRWPRPARARAAAGRGLAFVGGLVAVQLFCIARHFGVWPLPAWIMYARRMSYADIETVALKATLENGETRWLQGGWRTLMIFERMSIAVKVGDLAYARAAIPYALRMLPPGQTDGVRSVALVQRKAVLEPGGGFRFVEVPLAPGDPRLGLPIAWGERR